MISAIWSRRSEWELLKAGPHTSLAMVISSVLSPSSLASYLLGTALRLLSLRIAAVDLSVRPFTLSPMADIKVLSLSAPPDLIKSRTFALRLRLEV